MRLRSSLFLKIYLTFLAGLVALVAISGLVFVVTQHGEGAHWAERRDRFLQAMIPPPGDSAGLQAMLDRLSEAVEGDISVFADDGRLIAAAGDPIPYGAGKGRSGAFSIDLPDGRRIAVRLTEGFSPGRFSPLLYLGLVALVMAAAAYPVVRHLTRRLEALRQGAEAWGAGDLAIRVNDRGRDEVAAVARSFNTAADRIEALLAAHRQLLAHASHELRSPLARLRMAIDLRPDGKAEEEIVRNLGEIDALVEEILLGSRLDHHARALDREEIDLLALAAEEGARHGVDVSGRSVTMRGDARLLRRLISNLMQNALKHGAPPVTATVVPTSGGTRIEVSDCGAGIPDGEVERMFEPFYRPGGTSESAGGWGLGLSLVRQIAELHGGAVTYVRKEDGGACFRVDLPADTQL
jgi:signal transduction histidine kinase